MADFLIVRPKVNRMNEPVIDTVPYFSWQMQSAALSKKQRSYRIFVRQTGSVLTQERLVWDSATVYSDRSVGIKYEGEKLSPCTVYEWTVCVTDENGAQAESKPSRFETGLEYGKAFEGVSFISVKEQKNEADGQRGEPAVRKTFALQNKPIVCARVYATAVGVYDLYLNGERVGTQEKGNTVYDEMKPGWTDYDRRLCYSTYDIASYLHTGADNCMVSLLSSGWALGRITSGWTDNRTYHFTKPAFACIIRVFYADGSCDEFQTDETWQGTFRTALRFADIYDGEIYDANLPDGRQLSHAERNATEQWTEVEKNEEFQGKITAFIGPAVRVRQGLTRVPSDITVYNGVQDNATDYGEIAVTGKPSTAEELTLPKGSTVIYDMGQNMVGFPVICLTAEKNTAVKIRFAEMLNDSGSKSRGNDGAKGSLYAENYRNALSSGTYIACGNGEEEYRPLFTFYGFRYVSVCADADITVKYIRGEVLGSDIRETGRLTTDNESVNQLIRNILWGQRGNYLSIPTDCPQRNERLGWTGDAQIFCATAAYNADICAFMHKWLQDARDSQRDGKYSDVIPRVSYVGSGNAAWGDAGIIVPYTVYRMYGDTAVIHEMYDSMEEYMTFLEQKRGFRGANIAYGDWLSYESNDEGVKDLVACAYYAYDCLLMEKMSESIGREDRAAYYRSRYQAVKQYFSRRHRTVNGSLKKKCSSQTCWLLGLKTGMFGEGAPKEAAIGTLCEKIRQNGNRLSTGFVGTGILAQTLSDCGQDALAYTLLLQREDPSWLYSVDQGATTIWERWNSYTLKDGFGDAGMNSFNHYAYGVIGEWMYAYMAGIKPDDSKPGFRHIHLRPTPDTRRDSEIPDGQQRLTSVDCTVETAYGEVNANWRYADGVFDFTAAVPANTTATVYLPCSDVRTLTVNGKAYDRLDREKDGIVYAGLENERAVFEAGSGQYIFKTRA